MKAQELPVARWRLVWLLMKKKKCRREKRVVKMEHVRTYKAEGGQLWLVPAAAPAPQKRNGS